MRKPLCVVPCYNEQINLPALFADIKETGMTEFCDFLFVDDASKDNTNEMIAREGFRLIRHAANKGYGGSVKTGLHFALEKKYESFVLFPGDHQRKAADAIKLLGLLNDLNCDVVVGSKFHIYSKKYGPIGRRWGNRVFSQLAKILWRSPIVDVLSGFKAYRVATTFQYLDKSPSGYPMDIVFNMYASIYGLRQAEVPVACRYDQHTTKMKSIIYVCIKMLIATIVHYIKELPAPLMIQLRKHQPKYVNIDVIEKNRAVEAQFR